MNPSLILAFISGVLFSLLGIWFCAFMLGKNGEGKE